AQYLFVPYAKDQVVAFQGHEWVVGRLDADGNFEEEFPYRVDRSNSLRSPPFRLLALCQCDRFDHRIPAYEFRSGRLIKGEQLGDGSFVPELGSEVKMLSEYRVGDQKELPIWNFPGMLMPKERAEQFGLKGRPWP